MILRRVKYLVTLLLVLSAFAATTAQSHTFAPVPLPPVAATTSFLDLFPPTGPIGTDVKINGTIASASTTSTSTQTATVSGTITTETGTIETSCSIYSPTNNLIITQAACTINGGTNNGNFTGSFIVGNVLPGQYVIEVTSCVGNDGCAPSVGDFVQSIFTVTAGPSIRVYPVVCGATGTSGGCEAGAHVFVNGTGFLPTDTTCAL
ncbi:MAG: hypothetical protein ACLP9D_14875, partial [Candidatus Bathyarchaeia archaeon]